MGKEGAEEHPQPSNSPRGSQGAIPAALGVSVCAGSLAVGREGWESHHSSPERGGTLRGRSREKGMLFWISPRSVLGGYELFPASPLALTLPEASTAPVPAQTGNSGGESPALPALQLSPPCSGTRSSGTCQHRKQHISSAALEPPEMLIAPSGSSQTLQHQGGLCSTTGRC